jgi:hypothetical protein
MNEYEKYKASVERGEVIVAFRHEWLTFNPGVQEFKVLEEGDKYYVIDSGDGKPSAIEKRNSIVNEDKTKIMIMSSPIR